MQWQGVERGPSWPHLHPLISTTGSHMLSVPLASGSMLHTSFAHTHSPYNAGRLQPSALQARAHTLALLLAQEVYDVCVELLRLAELWIDLAPHLASTGIASSPGNLPLL